MPYQVHAIFPLPLLPAGGLRQAPREFDRLPFKQIQLETGFASLCAIQQRRCDRTELRVLATLWRGLCFCKFLLLLNGLLIIRNRFRVNVSVPSSPPAGSVCVFVLRCYGSLLSNISFAARVLVGVTRGLPGSFGALWGGPRRTPEDPEIPLQAPGTQRGSAAKLVGGSYEF